jgi:hypothetical protein
VRQGLESPGRFQPSKAGRFIPEERGIVKALAGETAEKPTPSPSRSTTKSTLRTQFTIVSVVIDGDGNGVGLWPPPAISA